MQVIPTFIHTMIAPGFIAALFLSSLVAANTLPRAPFER